MLALVCLALIGCGGSDGAQSGKETVSIVTESLPAAATSQNFSYTVQAAGVSGNSRWSLKDAPEWLCIDDETGTLQGNPPAGTSEIDVTVQVTDSSSRAVKNLKLSVAE